MDSPDCADGPDMGGSGDGYDGLALDADVGGLDGMESIDIDYGADDGKINAPEPRRKVTGDSLSDTLLLSYDHCDVYDGGSSCLGGGYDLVDAVKGTFSDDVFDPNGSLRPLNKRYLTPAQVELIKKAADDPKRRVFGIHVTNHGLIMLNSEFKEIAEKAGCVRIDTVTPNFYASDEMLPELADWNTWKPPFTRRRVPAGFYPNATGTTRVWKQYWQVKHKDGGGWLLEDHGPKHNPKWRFDRFCNTVLEVTCVTWYYREACDYETRFSIRVMSTPYLDPHDKQWGYLKEPFERHQKMARSLAELMLHRLKACPPHPVAVKNRGEILKKARESADKRRERERYQRELCLQHAAKEAAAQKAQPEADNAAHNAAPGAGTPAQTAATNSVENASHPAPSTRTAQRASGADLGAALGHVPELVEVKIQLPRRT